MVPTVTSPRIGVYGAEEAGVRRGRGCGLWPAGYEAAITAAGGEPMMLPEIIHERCLSDVMEELDGLVLAGSSLEPNRHRATEDRLCQWCRRRGLPLLGVDHGLHVLNQTHGGSIFHDLSRELPEALQHRHPPEEGVRHAINVVRDTRLATLYGEGEVVVNSEHRRAVQRLARGFHACAHALDGVIEAIEFETEDWFALGVQWHPASVTASGLDIQLFRGLIDACHARRQKPSRPASRLRRPASSRRLLAATR